MAGDHHVKLRGWGGEPGAMPCERLHLRFFCAFQVWRRRRSNRNIIRTPSDTNTLRKEPHCSTIPTGNSGSLSALGKRSSTIPTPKNASMPLRELCRATIPTRGGESLSALTKDVAVGVSRIQGMSEWSLYQHVTALQNACRLTQYQPPTRPRRL